MKKGRPTLLTVEIGEQFGDLICIDKRHSEEKQQTVYTMECTKCHRKKDMISSTIRLGHGLSHTACGKGLKTKDKVFYNRWQSMRHRTTNPNNAHYKDYGGRGINSDEFENFIDFYDAMYESYRKLADEIGENNTSLERIDVNGNYCKDNCTWIHVSEQKNNQRKSRRFYATFPDGHTEYCVGASKFAREHNLDAESIRLCLTGDYKQHKGFTFKNAS